MMKKDRYRIAMENLSEFFLERSNDLEEWEDASHSELEQILEEIPDEKARSFLSVVRGGSMCQLQGYFYRIRPL